ncbi:MAG: hypothetical protein KDJ65_12050 [Anaerolineae bacterium]|nr:hypothetical protein [Anaerolineae bacterium]
MYAVEFRATVKNGVIEIPPEYRDKLQDNVKVIILAEDKRERSDMISKLLDSPLKIADFEPIPRAEIYERS